MVHALEKAASCLNQGGVILEVHDLLDPPRIEVHSDGAEIFAGQLLSEVNFEKQQFADDAIGQVVATGKLSSDRDNRRRNDVCHDGVHHLRQSRYPQRMLHGGLTSHCASSTFA